MLLQKTFHVHQSPDVAAARLASLDSYVHGLAAFQTASLDESGAQFEFVTGQGFHGKCRVERLTADEPSQVLFCSTSGNMDVTGLIEFLPVRESLTEIQITLDYTIHSPFHRMVDLVTNSMERFVNQQLEVLRASCEGGHLSEATRFSEAIIFPAEVQLAH
jgi:hypothetical protein